MLMASMRTRVAVCQLTSPPPWSRSCAMRWHWPTHTLTTRNGALRLFRFQRPVKTLPVKLEHVRNSVTDMQRCLKVNRVAIDPSIQPNCG